MPAGALPQCGMDMPKRWGWMCRYLNRLLPEQKRQGICWPEGAVRMEVADNGNGIPREELPFVFDRFYQVNKSEREASGGVGLGLAIAKRIMDLHTSSIEVFSEPHSSSRFDFSLPVYA